MMKLWDYFMRRKTLLVLTVMVFAVSSFLTYRALNTRVKADIPQYISIENWGTDEVEIPQTGGVAPIIAVLQPNELLALSDLVRDNTLEDQSEIPDSDFSEPEVFEPMEDLDTNGNEDFVEYDDEDSDMTEPPTVENDMDEQIANEELDNLEQTALPDSVVLEVLPPNKQMSDEVLNAAVDALGQQKAQSEVNDDIDKVHKAQGFDFSTLLMGIIVFGLGGYLTYWHFRR